MNLYPHQIEALEFLLEKKRCILASEPRTGKTLPAVAAAMKNLPALIICPAIVKSVIERACAVVDPTVPVTVIDGRIAAHNLVAGQGVFIMSYDVAPYLLHFTGWNTLVLDEAHRIASNTAKRTKAAVKLMKKTPHVYCLTGTPIPRHPIGLFPMLHGLGIYKGSWMAFAFRYAKAWQSPWGFDTTGSSNLPELRDKIKPHILRHTKEQVFVDYQEPAFSIITFDLPVSRREQEFDAESLVVNPNVILALEGLSELLLESARKKVKSCIEFISDLVESGQPVIVFAVHKEIVASLELGLKEHGVVKVVGDTPAKERDQNIADFQSGKASVIIGNVAAMSEGVDLSRGDTIVFVETGWSPATLTQASSRVENLQKKGGATIYLLTTANSLDHRVIKTILKKKGIIDQII